MQAVRDGYYKAYFAAGGRAGPLLPADEEPEEVKRGLTNWGAGPWQGFNVKLYYSGYDYAITGRPVPRGRALTSPRQMPRLHDYGAPAKAAEPTKLDLPRLRKAVLEAMMTEEEATAAKAEARAAAAAAAARLAATLAERAAQPAEPRPKRARRTPPRFAS